MTTGNPGCPRKPCNKTTGKTVEKCCLLVFSKASRRGLRKAVGWFPVFAWPAWLPGQTTHNVKRARGSPCRGSVCLGVALRSARLLDGLIMLQRAVPLRAGGRSDSCRLDGLAISSKRTSDPVDAAPRRISSDSRLLVTNSQLGVVIVEVC